MKVFMLNGSPHKNGSTKTALEEMTKIFDKEGISWEIYDIPSTPVRGCIACGKCTDGHCTFDDCVNEIIDKIKDSDAVVFGSPVYYAGMNGTLKCILDRVFYAGKNEYFAYKPAAAIVSCRRGGASNTYNQINYYFGISKMIQVGSQYWNNIHGNNREEALKDLEGLQIMRTLAGNMSWMMKCIEKDGTVPEMTEGRISTNFIR